MVIAYHLVWTGYGWWLPNDPRGSGSHVIVKDSLRDLGELHFGRRPVQPSPATVRSFYAQAQADLEYPLLRFDPDQIASIGEGFGEAIRKHSYTCYACAVLPDHAHLVIRKHRDQAETMIENLQRASALALFDAGLVDINHPVWIEGGWKVYLDTPARILTTIRYVERNPEKEGLPPQKWPFVTQYDNWPFHKKK